MLEQGLRLRELSDYGGTFTYPSPGTVGYPCSLGANNEGTRLSPSGGGFMAGGQETVVIRKSVLPANINFQAGHRASLTDKHGRISPLQIAPEGVKDLRYAWSLTLQDAHANA